MKTYELIWQESWDEYDNSIWEAASPYHDDGLPFQFSLKQRLIDNNHIWYDDSDPEVRINGDDYPESWISLEAAKNAFQTVANEMWKEA